MELRVKQSSYKGAALAGTIDLGDLTVNRLASAQCVYAEILLGEDQGIESTSIGFCIERSSLA
jgi:hypothetical protein